MLAAFVWHRVNRANHFVGPPVRRCTGWHFFVHGTDKIEWPIVATGPMQPDTIVFWEGQTEFADHIASPLAFRFGRKVIG